jgi:FlaA1/EpsC-like NDP-sugar epimerase
MNHRNKETVFITGANGFVGEVLVSSMIREKRFNLIVNDRERSLDDAGVTSASVDLADAASIRDFFKTHSPDHIIHLGAVARLRDGEEKPELAYRINYLGSKTLIDCAIKHQAKTFLFVSSDMARNHKSAVGITKYLTEAYIQKTNTQGTRFIIVRLPNISWTPGSVHLIFDRLIKANKPLTITHPDMSRRFITREEAAGLILHALREGNDKDIWIVTKPPQKITELAREMIDEAGKDPGIDFIGIKPGEKLVEEGYRDDQLIHTSKQDFSLLKEVNFEENELSEAIEMLNAKPGFSIKTSKNL